MTAGDDSGSSRARLGDAGDSSDTPGNPRLIQCVGLGTMKDASNKPSEDDRFLEELRIASPCTASWEGMAGDQRVRSCGDCRMQVYDLSGMSREQAVDLVEHHEGRLCIRMLRRPDGTVITKDCPVGLRVLRQRLALAALRCAALVGFLLASLMGCTRQQWRDGLQQIFSSTKPVDAQLLMGEVFVPEFSTVPRPEAVMGRIALPRK